MSPSTRLAGYRCSLPGLAGFAGVPSPGTALFLSQKRPRSSVDARRGMNAAMARLESCGGKKAPALLAARPGRQDREARRVQGPLAGPLLLPERRHARAARPRRATSRTASRTSRSSTPRSSAAARTATRATASSSRSTSSRSACSPTRRTASMEAYGAWGEKVLYGKKSIGVIRSTVHHRPRRQGRAPLGPREVRRPRRPVREKLKELRAA